MIIFKFTWNFKGSQIYNIVLKKINKARVLTLTNFKARYKATIIKTVEYYKMIEHTQME